MSFDNDIGWLSEKVRATNRLQYQVDIFTVNVGKCSEISLMFNVDWMSDEMCEPEQMQEYD